LITVWGVNDRVIACAVRASNVSSLQAKVFEVFLMLQLFVVTLDLVLFSYLFWLVSVLGSFLHGKNSIIATVEPRRIARKRAVHLSECPRPVYLPWSLAFFDCSP
jgi:hypothetical protein